MGPWIAYIMLVIVAVTAMVTDVRTGKVRNVLTYPAIIVGLVWAAAWGAIDPELTTMVMLENSLLALGGALICFSVIVALGGLGGGDIKLMVAVGAISASWEVVFMSTFYAFLIAGVMAAYLLIRHGIVKRTAQRLMVAAIQASARIKPEFDTDTKHVPFAVAAGLGAMLAHAEFWLGLNLPWSAAGLH